MKNAGFTLLELMVGLLISTILINAMLEAYVMLQQTDSYAERYAQMQQHALRARYVFMTAYHKQQNPKVFQQFFIAPVSYDLYGVRPFALFMRDAKNHRHELVPGIQALSIVPIPNNWQYAKGVTISFVASSNDGRLKKPWQIDLAFKKSG